MKTIPKLRLKKDSFPTGHVMAHGPISGIY